VKSAAERMVEALTWAFVVIWLGFALVTHILGYVWVVVMILSIILLSSAIYQRSRGWHTSLSIWVFGIWMAVFSVLETVSSLLAAAGDGEGLQIDLWVYLGVALVSMGVAVILRMIQPDLLAGGADTERRDRDDARPYIPRRVVEDSSSGYIPPSRERPGRGRRRAADQSRRDPYGYQPAEDHTLTDDSAHDEPARYTGRDPRGYDPELDYAPRDEYAYDDDSALPPARPRQGEYEHGPTTPYDDRDYHTYQEPPAPAEEYPYDRQPPARDQGPGYEYDYGAPEYGQAGRLPPRKRDRRRATRQPRRRERPVETPSDMEARIEDIIRRARERRSAPPEDLPY